jgi:hypothetical protein
MFRFCLFYFNEPNVSILFFLSSLGGGGDVTTLPRNIRTSTHPLHTCGTSASIRRAGSQIPRPSTSNCCQTSESGQSRGVLRLVLGKDLILGKSWKWFRFLPLSKCFFLPLILSLRIPLPTFQPNFTSPPVLLCIQFFPYPHVSLGYILKIINCSFQCMHNFHRWQWFFFWLGNSEWGECAENEWICVNGGNKYFLTSPPPVVPSGT